MRVLRWVLMGLYAAVVIGLVALGHAGLAPSVLSLPFNELKGKPAAAVLLLIVTVGSQALFIFGVGTINLCHPIKRRRLTLPVAIASAMITILVLGVVVAFSELYCIDIPGVEASIWNWLISSFVAVNWIVWGFVLYFYTRARPRFQVIQRLTATLLAGSLAELLAAVPAHVIVTRRPGCLVGLWTGMGIVAGLCVMLWAFGPAIALLFLRDRYRSELGG